MENMGVNPFWAGKRVLVTGHTGFKGSWLTLWLEQLGATVYGFALNPDTSPSLFDQMAPNLKIDHLVGDIRDQTVVNERITAVQPDVMFHLAAQPLVRQSYAEPLLTWQTNVMGTVYALEALRDVDDRCAIVIATTDKVYENREWPYAYRETDPLGGNDPYSSSKSAAELAAAAWRSSFFSKTASLRIATARAGNVIGGGDWAADRLVPDLVRALTEGVPALVRNPASVRPWQHVLEPLSGYLRLAQALYESDNLMLQGPFNFGPRSDALRTVAELADECMKHSSGEWQTVSEEGEPHEASQLALTTEKAHLILGWQPTWSFAESVRHTMSWYQAREAGVDAAKLCLDQISEYEQTS